MHTKKGPTTGEWDGYMTHRLKTFCLLNDPVLFGLHSMRSHNEMLNNKKT